VVVWGSGRMKVDDEIIELEEGCGARPTRDVEATKPDRRGSRSSSSAHPVWDRLGARTWMGSMAGGLTSKES